MLKVCSILMIIGGALALLLSALGFAGVAAAASLLDGEATAEVTTAYIWLAVAIVASIIELVAGIVGVQAAKMPSANKIKLSLVLGLLVVVISLASSISSIITAGFSTSTITSLLTGLVVPVLYLIGLIQYKNALVALLSGE